MAFFQNNQTVLPGLVFYYDMGNTSRSFLGQPATNLISNASTMTGWSDYNYGNNGTFITEFGTTGYQIIDRQSWNGLYRTFNLGSTGNYTFSAWIRYNGGTINNNGATVYISNYGSSDVAASVDKSLVGQWQRISYTVNVTNPGNVYFYLISYGGSYGSGTDFSSWEVTMPQIETGTVMTNWVSDAQARTNTNNIRDLTYNNPTLTANNLTYNSNNTFSFNGSNGSITFPNNTIFDNQQVTVEAWIKTNALSQNGFFFEKGAVNTQYSLFQEGSNIVWRQASNSMYVTTSNFISTSNYAQVLGTYVSGDRRLYINGVLVNNDSQTGALGTNSSGQTIGMYNSGGYYYNGIISIIRVYNRVLTPAEVAQNFAATRGRYNI